MLRPRGGGPGRAIATRKYTAPVPGHLEAQDARILPAGAVARRDCQNSRLVPTTRRNVTDRIGRERGTMTKSSYTIQNCQVCRGTDLKPILFLGYLPPVNQMHSIGARPA